MTRRWVECVPNISEGRRPEVVAAVAAAVKAVAGVYLLDCTSDPDHHRSVLTFVGSPEGVVQAAFEVIRVAAEQIDLDEHCGQHPRIGAADVIPFVPLSGTTLEECAELARQLGQRVGQELGLPIYLYGAAATRPDRQNLEDVRRGQYEGLKLAIETDSTREPDFGPRKLGKAGAVAIGARLPLIAFNVYLTTDDVSVAHRIAVAIRHSSGGLRYVKALGVLVGGRAQVSMNLTDYTQTPIARVVELVRREAARYGVGIHHTELIGLVPQDALTDAAQWYLQLDDSLAPTKILENRLAAIEREQSGEPAFLERLAAGTAAPGGGAAAAYAGAMAAALAGMTSRLAANNPRYAAIAERMVIIAQQADRLRQTLEAAAAEDAAAFEAFLAARQLPEGAPRAAVLEQALIAAIQSPLRICRSAVEVIDLLAEIAVQGSVSAIGDAAAGMWLAQAAFRTSATNVRLNASLLADPQMASQSLVELEGLAQQVEQGAARVSRALHERAKLATT